MINRHMTGIFYGSHIKECKNARISSIQIMHSLFHLLNKQSELLSKFKELPILPIFSRLHFSDDLQSKSISTLQNGYSI